MAAMIDCDEAGKLFDTHMNSLDCSRPAQLDLSELAGMRTIIPLVLLIWWRMPVYAVKARSHAVWIHDSPADPSRNAVDNTSLMVQTYLHSAAMRYTRLAVRPCNHADLKRQFSRP